MGLLPPGARGAQQQADLRGPMVSLPATSPNSQQLHIRGPVLLFPQPRWGHTTDAVSYPAKVLLRVAPVLQWPTSEAMREHATPKGHVDVLDDLLDGVGPGLRVGPRERAVLEYGWLKKFVVAAVHRMPASGITFFTCLMIRARWAGVAPIVGRRRLQRRITLYPRLGHSRTCLRRHGRISAASVASSRFPARLRRRPTRSTSARPSVGSHRIRGRWRTGLSELRRLTASWHHCWRGSAVDGCCQPARNTAEAGLHPPISLVE